MTKTLKLGTQGGGPPSQAAPTVPSTLQGSLWRCDGRGVETGCTVSGIALLSPILLPVGMASLAIKEDGPTVWWDLQWGKCI